MQNIQRRGIMWSTTLSVGNLKDSLSILLQNSRTDLHTWHSLGRGSSCDFTDLAKPNTCANNDVKRQRIEKVADLENKQNSQPQLQNSTSILSLRKISLHRHTQTVSPSCNDSTTDLKPYSDSILSVRPSH